MAAGEVSIVWKVLLEQPFAVALLNQNGVGTVLKALPGTRGIYSGFGGRTAYFAQAELATQKGDMADGLGIRLKDLKIRRELLAADPRNGSLRSNMALVSKRISMGRLEEAYVHYAAAIVEARTEQRYRVHTDAAGAYAGSAVCRRWKELPDAGRARVGLLADRRTAVQDETGAGGCAVVGAG